MRRGASAVAAVVAAVAVALLLLGGCSKEPTPGTTTTTTERADLPFDGSPSAPEVADAAGLEWPESMTGYRSVRIDDSELDVTFELDVADVPRFAEASGLGELTAGRRIVVHMSPLWDLNPPAGATVESAESTADGIARRVEVITGPGAETSSVRLVVAAT